tara:strand:- start:517 stop:708 length:192 start_codon:yes stop_codon:yes gene_type:complete
MEETHLQETQLEYEPIIKDEITWEQAVQKIEIILNDLCSEYDKKGHPYYSEALRQYWRRVLKG